MYQNVKHTCRVLIFLIKPIVLRRSRCRCRRRRRCLSSLVTQLHLQYLPLTLIIYLFIFLV